MASLAPSKAGQQVSSHHRIRWSRRLTSLRIAVCGAVLCAFTPVRAQEAALNTIEWLHAGEAGHEARALGDRVRLAIWLSELAPTDAQIQAMEAASAKISDQLNRLHAAEASGDQSEIEARRPAYKEILERLQSDEENLDDLEFTPDTSQMRTQASKRVQLTREVLNEASRFTRALEPDQREAMQHALFVLRRPTSRYANPDFYDRLMASAWPDSAFASLRRVADPGVSNDPKTLWLLDQGSLDVTDGLTGTALDLVTALTLGHALLPEALNFHRGLIGTDLYLGHASPVAESAEENATESEGE